jgi:hypothetical protein
MLVSKEKLDGCKARVLKTLQCQMAELLKVFPQFVELLLWLKKSDYDTIHEIIKSR